MRIHYEKSDEKSNVIVYTGGGTGGHIYPNLALIPTLRARGFDAIYIGGEGDTLEHRLAKESNIPYYGVPAIKLVRSLSPDAIKNNAAIPIVLNRAKHKASTLLEGIRPVCIFSKGGFVSLPVVLAAKELNIPVFAHESDLTLGLANKIAKACGAHILKANPNAGFKGECVGIPLREELFCKNKLEARKKLGIINPSDKKILLVMGGSSGAQAINSAVLQALDKLGEHYFVLHVTGKQKGEQTKRRDYMSVEYADDISLFYAAADVLVSRAGATSVFEISALKKRAVFVPLPKGISRGDQIYNAELAKQYGGVVLWQDNRLCDKLLPSIEAALQNPPMRAIIDDSNGKIADIVCDTLRRGEKCKNKKPSPNGLQ